VRTVAAVTITASPVADEAFPFGVSCCDVAPRVAFLIVGFSGTFPCVPSPGATIPAPAVAFSGATVAGVAIPGATFRDVAFPDAPFSGGSEAMIVRGEG
jgi:hypothetical protein